MPKKNKYTVGSVCSGIEAASIAWKPLGFKFEWFSEIADFPSKVLKEKYPRIKNIGNMVDIPDLLKNKKIKAPDIICGGTPCQAFSYAGWKNGLNDNRGNLTLKFVDIIEANDEIRENNGLQKTIIFWENVEGVLTDKTNAFGCFISSLAGLPKAMKTNGKWPSAGMLRGPKRNVAWRVLDAKYFGLPQQRRRLYVMAGGDNFHPENILFEKHTIKNLPEFPNYPLTFQKDGQNFEIFRCYTDCLYSSYGTKWNGNAAANNGSLFVIQNNRLRRLSPLECERLMGFPDNYTKISSAKRTNRYQALGNSWAVPVIKWIGKRIINPMNNFLENPIPLKNDNDIEYHDFNNGIIKINDNVLLNCSIKPEKCTFGNMMDILSTDVPKEIYISPVGCYGILRRSKERNLSVNKRLETILNEISEQMSIADIEKYSLRQQRGKHSKGEKVK
ncbi:DNA cytosine methyltransferase [Faecalibacillus intestinalis]|uniref:DNA cytosine methyltransferase n=1 Tax=Faecalibacillus intestinalis TaxID=1982626 RepID=UPI000E4AD28F|nr:DNA cytosine methyltransferase [Faecalibacillus intestinalis]RGG32406.1 restriction endonuclease subunit M [Coprobacillus sp. AF24-1LB]